jgi:hypothetical protein
VRNVATAAPLSIACDYKTIVVGHADGAISSYSWNGKVRGPLRSSGTMLLLAIPWP